VIFDTDDEHTYSVTVNKNLNQTGKQAFQTKIDTIRLDEFIRDNHIPKTDLLKIDVETHEAAVLEGMKEILKRDMPALLIEILNDEVAKGVSSILDPLGYLYFSVNEKKGPVRTSSIKPHGDMNYLCCKKELATDLGLL
jgi:hypothetical protein